MKAMAAISLISFIPHGNFDSYEAASPAACETMLPILGNLCVQHTCFEPLVVMSVLCSCPALANIVLAYAISCQKKARARA